jgi:hypothetical protein
MGVGLVSSDRASTFRSAWMAPGRGPGVTGPLGLRASVMKNASVLREVAAESGSARSLDPDSEGFVYYTGEV